MPNKVLNCRRLMISVLMLTLSILFPNVTLAFTDLTPQQRCADNDINYKEATRLAKRIRKAVERKDKKTLANMMHYPASVGITKQTGEKLIPIGKRKMKWPILKSSTLIIRSKQQFLRQYDKIIIPQLVNEIMKLPFEVSCTYEGGSAYFGTFWFRGRPLRILVINQPTTH